MRKRILSAVVGISIALGLLIGGYFFPVVINLSIAVLAVMCVVEGLSAKKLNIKLGICIPSIAFTFLLCLLYEMSFSPVIVYLFFFMLFCVMIFNHENLVFYDLAYAVTITVLCTLGMLTMEVLFNTSVSVPVGIFYVVTSLATPWLADAGAYFGGSAFGKRKLCPNISPKKTVEGAASGVIVGTLLTLLVGVIFEKFIFNDGETVNYVLLAVYGLLGTVVSVVGDLSFSLIKRSCGVKDFGDILPGHGGMLDRFDSVIFSAPLLLIFNMYFPIVTGG